MSDKKQDVQRAIELVDEWLANSQGFEEETWPDVKQYLASISKNMPDAERDKERELKWKSLLDAMLAEWYRFGDGQAARLTADEVEAVDFCLTAYRDSIKRAEAAEKQRDHYEHLLYEFAPGIMEDDDD